MKIEEGWFHLERQKLSEQGKQGLELLVQNPYWKRKWIIQEILLSGVNASLVVGVMQVQLANIVSFLYDEINVAERAQRMNKNEEVWQMTYEPRELSSLLAEYSDFECQEPQDHIFALLSLATPESSQITVDYNADLTKLY
ncbi:hypothetical protein N0V94_002495 [Neodidymelliopsis sp. IMI 364377]|nr:hypothetical protein N0V94_002495 [Neodidymelliopsis sp. IMI 364377]